MNSARNCNIVSLQTIHDKSELLDAYSQSTANSDPVAEPWLREIPLLPCDQSRSQNGAISYCCDPGATECCAAANWQSVPVGTIIRSPVSASSTSSSTPGPSTGTPISTIPIPTSSAAVQRDLKAMKIGLGVGLGLGLPIIIILIVVLGLLLREMRRTNRAAQLEPPQETLHIGKGKPEQRQEVRPVSELHIPRQELEAAR